MKKSPRLLLAKYFGRRRTNNEEEAVCHEAKNIIEKFYKDDQDAQREYESITKHLRHNEEIVISNKGAMLPSFSISVAYKEELVDDDITADFTRAVSVGAMMNIFQQITGCNVIFYNSQTILDQDLYTDSDQISVILLYGVNFIATLICVCFMKYKFVKHKTLLFVGTAMMLTSVVLLGFININVTTHTVTCNKHDMDELKNSLALSKLPFFVVGYAIGISGYTWLLNTEIFPLCHRIKFGSFCIFIQWFCNGVISILVYNGIIDPTKTHMYFICACTICACIAFFGKYIKETKGESLEHAIRIHNPGIIWAS